jgi:hypothetical protein
MQNRLKKLNLKKISNNLKYVKNKLMKNGPIFFFYLVDYHFQSDLQ